MKDCVDSKFNTLLQVNSSRSAQKDKEDSIKLARTIAIIFFVYCCCWAPYTVVSVSNNVILYFLSV